MSLEWQDELATGIENIDAQHKGIFDRFAAFTAACNDGCAKEDILDLFGYLEDYTREHFRDEEMILEDAEYPDLAVQQKNHKMFLGEIEGLKEKIGENDLEMSVILEMKRLLIRWLIHHVKHQDMAYVDFLKGPAANR